MTKIPSSSRERNKTHFIFSQKGSNRGCLILFCYHKIISARKVTMIYTDLLLNSMLLDDYAFTNRKSLNLSRITQFLCVRVLKRRTQKRQQRLLHTSAVTIYRGGSCGLVNIQQITSSATQLALRVPVAKKVSNLPIFTVTSVRRRVVYVDPNLEVHFLGHVISHGYDCSPLWWFHQLVILHANNFHSISQMQFTVGPLFCHCSMYLHCIIVYIVFQMYV